jgi:hypothetical protein
MPSSQIAQSLRWYRRERAGLVATLDFLKASPQPPAGWCGTMTS